MIWNQTNRAGSLTLPSAKSTPCQPHRSKLSISLVDSRCFVGRSKTFPCKYKIRKKKSLSRLCACGHPHPVQSTTEPSLKFRWKPCEKEFPAGKPILIILWASKLHTPHLEVSPLGSLEALTFHTQQRLRTCLSWRWKHVDRPQSFFYFVPQE